MKIAASVFSWGVAALASFSASREAVVSSHTRTHNFWFTLNHIAYFRRSADAVHVAGGTATHLALLHAQSTFAAAKMPPESKKILLLLTDGCPDDQKSCVDAANALRAHIVRFFRCYPGCFEARTYPLNFRDVKLSALVSDS